MKRRWLMTCGAMAAVGLLEAASVETAAEFALDNVLASRRVQSGETLPVVRDAAWADGGVTFSMTGAPDEVLTAGAVESLVAPDVSHLKLFTVALRAGGEAFSYSFLVFDGSPNVAAEAAAEFPLDSRTGEVRKAKPRETIAYSCRWSDGATDPVLSFAGPGGQTDETQLSGEGGYAWNVSSPHVPHSIPPGLYTLAHHDGNETLTAQFRVPALGMLILVR